jgi:uncharacterized membrane-anchored protein YjiN (DUF445 family)
VTETDPDAAARAKLARYKASATLLLAFMALLVVVARLLPPTGWTALLGAASRAGLIGGLADWFAVTALFRHPLGLPIPHTAILPRQKARLGAALGQFVANAVFTEADVATLLARLDAPSLLRGLTEDPAVGAPITAALAGVLPRLFAAMEDGRGRRLIERLLPRLLGGSAGGVLIARALRSLVAGGRHQEVFGFVLEQLKSGMAAQEGVLRRAIEDRVREQGGRLLGWAIGANVARRVLHAVNAEFEKMEPGDSSLRTAFDEWTRREIDRIENDPAHAADLGRAMGRVIGHETIRVWLWDVWTRLGAAIARDAADPDGRVQGVIQASLAEIGRGLTDDPAARERLNGALASVALRSLPGLRVQLADFIARVVSGWDTATVTEKLELRVGPDLQFVRVNGTLVGFLAGGFLQVVLDAFK